MNPFLFPLLLTASFLAAVTYAGDTPETQTQTTLLSASIGKWQNLVIRKSENIPMKGAEGSSPVSYYSVELDDYTRDRDGQGVFRESVRSLVYCDASGVKVTQKPGGIELQMSFEQSQGTELSRVRILASKQTDGDDVFWVVKFSGEGPVCEAFQGQLGEHVAEAEWVESIDTIRWQKTPHFQSN